MMKSPEKPLNILSFDVEDWYHPNLAASEHPPDHCPEDRVEAPTLRILNMLDETENRATFFVLGEVAQRFPQLVAEIAKRGHEIASHGYHHNLAYNSTRAQFETDLAKSVTVLTGITGTDILGYRAPSWSLGKATPWAWEVLHDLGFLYDSSIFPFHTFLYGDDKAPRFDYEIDLGEGRTIREIPPGVMEVLGRRVPYSGGFYFRVLPYEVIQAGIRHFNKRCKPAVLYLHPWELDVGQPRMKLPAKDRFIMYANIKKTEAKLLRLLRAQRFVSVAEYFGFTAASVPSQEIINQAEIG